MQNGHLSQEQYDEVYFIYYTELASMNDAGILERYMIANLKPKFNKEFSEEGECEIEVKIPCDSTWVLYSHSEECEEYKPKAKEEDMPVSIWLDRGTKKKLKAMSQATGNSVSSIVKVAVQWYIRNYKLSFDEKIIYDAALRILGK